MRKLLKKAAAVTLTAAMAASLTACGGSGDGAAKETGEAQAAGEDGEKIKLTLCVGRKNDLSFQQSAFEGSERVKKELGDKYEVNVVEMGEDATKWRAAFYDAENEGRWR